MIRSVILSDIIIAPERFQVRDTLDEETIDRYTVISDRLPPVLLARLEGSLFLVDGFHRHAAALRNGRDSILAETIDVANENVAWELSVKYNAANGLSLKPKERKAIARDYLQRFPDRSARWIAETVGIDHKTVEKIRKELEACGEFPHKDHYIRRDGKRYNRNSRRPPAATQPEEDIPGTPGTLEQPTLFGPAQSVAKGENTNADQEGMTTGVGRDMVSYSDPIVTPVMGTDEEEIPQNTQAVEPTLAVTMEACAEAGSQEPECQSLQSDTIIRSFLAEIPRIEKFFEKYPSKYVIENGCSSFRTTG